MGFVQKKEEYQKSLNFTEWLIKNVDVIEKGVFKKDHLYFKDIKKCFENSLKNENIEKEEK